MLHGRHVLFIILLNKGTLWQVNAWELIFFSKIASDLVRAEPQNADVVFPALSLVSDQNAM